MSNIETVEPQPKLPVAPARETSAIKEAIAGASSSLRIIAIGVVFAFLYWASSIVIAVLLSVLFAYFLDPFVTFLEHVHIPRALGRCSSCWPPSGRLVGAVGYLALGRLDTFVDDWPRYSAVLKRTATTVDRKLTNVDQQVSELTSQKRVPAAVENAQPVRTLLLRGLGSLYSILLVWTFLPFLIFFMLAAKRTIWKSTIELFPEGKRRAVRETLDQVSSDAAQLHRGQRAGRGDSDCRLRRFLLVDPSRLPIPDRRGFGLAEYDSLSRRGAFLAAAVRDWLDALEDGGTISRCGPTRSDRPSSTGHECVDASDRGTACSSQCSRRHDRAPILGMVVGSGWFDSGDPHYGGAQSHLRPRAILAAGWTAGSAP